MFANQLNSSVLATAVGSLMVLAAFTASSMTQTGSEVGVKGDKLEMPMKVSCTADCTDIDSRIDRAFETFVEHDRDAGVTTLIRIQDSAL